MARWTASAKWAEGPALDGQRDMPLALRLSEWLGLTGVLTILEGRFSLGGTCGTTIAFKFVLDHDDERRNPPSGRCTHRLCFRR